VQIEVFRRDGWTCRYCGGQTIFTPAMALLGELFPDHFPYVATWKGGATHPAVTARAAVVDHVVPGSLGGAWLDQSNMVTACWPCNERKGDLTLQILGWSLHPSADTSWDGLTTKYRRLWELAGRPTQHAHRAWLQALEQDL